jgi:ATP-dependent protease Clp ATPase subunit
MFEVPSTDLIAKVIVTVDCVTNNAAPTIVPRIGSVEADSAQEKTA